MPKFLLPLRIAPLLLWQLLKVRAGLAGRQRFCNKGKTEVNLDFSHNSKLRAGYNGPNVKLQRTKDGKETDFLITKNNTPWCSFEAKLKDDPIARHHYKHSRILNNIPVVQITHKNNILKKGNNLFYLVLASRFFC